MCKTAAYSNTHNGLKQTPRRRTTVLSVVALSGPKRSNDYKLITEHKILECQLLINQLT